MNVSDIACVDTTQKHLYTKLQMNSHNIKCKVSYKVDTDAGGNLLPFRV